MAEEKKCTTTTETRISLATLSSLKKERFVETVGHAYEKSPWIAEAVHASGPFSSLTALAKAMKSVVTNAGEERQLALLCAHPDLAGKVTADSAIEQKRAGLDSLTKEELARIREANAAYKKNFGFPFILAVRHATKTTILGALTGPRLTENSRSVEIAQALSQVHKIAWMRLLTVVQPAPTGFLTCHILDTARGCPAAGMRVTLVRKEESGGDRSLGEWITNSDGRLGGPAIKHGALQAGQYEWKFYTLDYFTAAGVSVIGACPFLNVIALAFGIDNPEDHYHVPLLVSPYSYSTYRGS